MTHLPLGPVPCPHCGRCPTCGRGPDYGFGIYPQPIVPWQPSWPSVMGTGYIYYDSTQTTTGGTLPDEHDLHASEGWVAPGGD